MATRRTAIVTGGNRGLGLEIARQLLAHDVFVVIGARDPVKGADAVRSLGGESADVATFVLDVNDTRSCQRFAEHVVKNHGAPGILVNNAGVYPESTDAHVVDTPTSVWRETFETNLFGALRMCREIVPHMRKLRYGRIVNVSSGLTRVAFPGSAPYASMKGAVEVLTRYLAKELGPRGIAVNTVAPGAVETDFSGGMVRDNPELNRRVAEMTALGRAGLPDDIGPMIASLLMDDNRWVNAQRIEVSGGMLI